VPDAELGEQRIDCSDLDTASAAEIPKFSGLDVIGPIRNDQRYR